MSPRLRTDEGITLAVYPDLLDWPATVAAATWTVDADGADLPAEVVSPAPESDLWVALFPPETPGEAVGVPRPGRPADGDVRRDEGA